MSKVNPAALGAALAGDLENFFVASTPGGIEAQEAAGQQKLVFSSDMPLDLGWRRPGGQEFGKDAFEKIGFVFGAPIDEVFQQATLPAGWIRKASDHAMWSYIHDEQGRCRVEVFYKAAFYDRNAHARLVQRYNYTQDWTKKGEELTCVQVVDKGDGDKVIATFGEFKANDYSGISDKHYDEAKSYLNEHFPGWQDPTAHW